MDGVFQPGKGAWERCVIAAMIWAVLCLRDAVVIPVKGRGLALLPSLFLEATVQSCPGLFYSGQEAYDVI